MNQTTLGIFHLYLLPLPHLSCIPNETYGFQIIIVRNCVFRSILNISHLYAIYIILIVIITLSRQCLIPCLDIFLLALLLLFLFLCLNLILLTQSQSSFLECLIW
jgi:hypothetical protein